MRKEYEVKYVGSGLSGTLHVQFFDNLPSARRHAEYVRSHDRATTDICIGAVIPVDCYQITKGKA